MRLTYVYCLVRSARRPRVPAGLPPLPGGSGAHLLTAGGGLWLVVTHVPVREYDEAGLSQGLADLDWVARRALAHEAVVEGFLRTPAVLPMKLFTLFTSDERALDHVARARRRVDRVLDRIERQHEWGLRLTFDGPPAREPRPHATARPESGAAYLAGKRDLLGGRRAGLADARTRADRLYRAMAREATAARRRPDTERAAPGSRLLVDAAFLVPVRRTGAFRAALRRQSRELGTVGLAVSLTGPWPPYHFVDARAATRRR